MPFVIEMTPDQSEACDRFLKDNPGHCELAREQDIFINEVKKLEEPTYSDHNFCIYNKVAIGQCLASGLQMVKVSQVPSQDFSHFYQPIQVLQGKKCYPEITKFPQEHPGQCFSQIQPQQIPPETSGNVPLEDLRKIGYVLFCFGNTEDLDKILEVLDNLFPTPHFTTGEIGVYRSLQNANILYLVIPPGRNDLTQQLINTSISLKGQTRENGEKWPLIARLHNPDLTQMTIPLN